MARWRSKSDDAGGEQTPTDPKEMEQPLGSGGETGEGGASVEGGEAKGTTVYPPPVPDAAGEKTTNVPPSKLLPTKAPGGEGVDELTRLRAVNAKLSDVVRNLGGNPNAVAEEVLRTMPEAQPMKGEGDPYTVSVPGSGLPKRVVHARDKAGAIEQYKAEMGVWSLPGSADVTEGGDSEGGESD